MILFRTVNLYVRKMKCELIIRPLHIVSAELPISFANDVISFALNILAVSIK